MAMKNLVATIKGIKIPRSISEARRFIKAPWEITGPCSDPEYEDALPNALDYRSHAPATPPSLARVPQSEAQHVLDIKYFTRDYRRNFKFQDRKTYRFSKAELEELHNGPTIFDSQGFPPAYDAKTQDLDLDKLPGNGYQA